MLCNMVYDMIINRFLSLADEAEAVQLGRFFKTGPGQYGEGDRFLGIRVPVTRGICREYASETGLEDIDRLLASPWHEVRLAGFLLLIQVYRKSLRGKADRSPREVIDFYLSRLDRCNNWDLVDMSCRDLLGDYVLRNPGERTLLRQLAEDDRLWHRRVGIVSTWTLIRDRDFYDILAIAPRQLGHSHDLIHKATGWMLREMGKRSERHLTDFLDTYAAMMPRTALRYAIEKLSPGQRSRYMAAGRQSSE